jgi:hypothetical protein
VLTASLPLAALLLKAVAIPKTAPMGEAQVAQSIGNVTPFVAALAAASAINGPLNYGVRVARRDAPTPTERRKRERERRR